MTSPIVAISIKTFNRPLELQKCIEAARKYCSVPFRFYIADDGVVSPEVEELYASLAAGGHVVKRYTARVSVTKARNDLVAMMTDERFMLRLDDDFMFSEETNIAAMIKIMEARPEIGAISDLERQIGDGKGIRSREISSKQGHTFLSDGTLFKINAAAENWQWFYTNGLRFSYANFTRNFLLIRREVFSKVRWNEDLFLQGEHTAFMLDLQNAGWALAFTPESVHIHDESRQNVAKSYRRARHDPAARQVQQKYYSATYGICRIKSLTIDDVAGAAKFRRIRRLWNKIQLFLKW